MTGTLMVMLPRATASLEPRASCAPALRNDGVETASKGMLEHLLLLFVPAGAGVVQNFDLLASHGIAIILVLALSVVVTLLATVLTFCPVSRLLTRRDAQ